MMVRDSLGLFSMSKKVPMVDNISEADVDDSSDMK
jgi:hypothetical protein